MGYADDLVLLTKGTCIQQMAYDTNKSLKKITRWMTKHNLTLSLSKCEAVWFTKTKRAVKPPVIKIYDNVIPYKNQTTYLGVCFNQNLKWNSHIQQVIKKANKGIQVMKTLAKTWWGADPYTPQIISHGLVRSHLEYGAAILNPIAQSYCNVLVVSL